MGLEGAAFSTTLGDASTAGTNGVSDEERSEREADRREASDRSNGERSDP
ncbi:hypothetical protein [Halobacterium wangiae]|nr:hypothetical protein [Halobacterium wangiae]